MTTRKRAEVLANAVDRAIWKSTISAYRLDTTEPPGWPLRFPWRCVPTPTVHDLDGDGRLETLIPSISPIHQTPIDSSRVHVIGADGEAAAGWPLLFEDMIIESEIAVTDLDLDGDMELIFGGGRNSESGWLSGAVGVVRDGASAAEGGCARCASQCPEAPDRDRPLAAHHEDSLSAARRAAACLVARQERRSGLGTRDTMRRSRWRALEPQRTKTEELSARIVAIAHPLRIVLFGSAACGAIHTNSDFDVLVVMPGGSSG